MQRCRVFLSCANHIILNVRYITLNYFNHRFNIFFSQIEKKHLHICSMENESPKRGRKSKAESDALEVV